MPRSPALAALVLLLLAACDSKTAGEEAGTTPAAQDLDALARETGALPDSDAADPVGLYERRYEGGGDRLCLTPEGTGGKRFRFGAETRFGGEEYCLGRGKARLAGNKLLLTFDGGAAGSACVIVTEYEGDRIVLPGSVDLTCAALCSGRGSFAGVSFPRAQRTAARASAPRDRDGKLLCR